MGDFHHSYARFMRRFNLRQMLSGALCGWAISLALVCAAPWMRHLIGAPDFATVIVLAAVLPVGGALVALLLRPARRERALLADRWSGGGGSVVTAVEVEAEHPFREPLESAAAAQLKGGKLPAPPSLRALLVVIGLLLTLAPVSRYVWAQRAATRDIAKAHIAHRPVVDPQDALKLARHAGATSDEAAKIGAEDQRKLADAIEDAARRAQAGADDRETALRQANSLAEQARNQTRDQDERAKARDAIKQDAATRALAEAAESADPAKIEQATSEVARGVFKDGKVDTSKASDLKLTLAKAAAAAPHDAELQAAVRAAQKALDADALKAAEERLENKRSELKAAGTTPEAIESSLKRISEEESKKLAETLKDFARAAHVLRDIDPDGAMQKQMLEQLMKDGRTPQEMQKMLDQARGMSKQLEVDAETLREMVKLGRQFPGLEDYARRMAEKSLKEGKTPDPSAMPDWGKGALPPETTPKPERTGDKVGVDIDPAKDGPRDPNAARVSHDPHKAVGEGSKIEGTGAKARTDVVDPSDELDHLPRRFRDAARKYFER